MKNIYEVQSENRLKSVLIIALFGLFILISVYVLAQAFGNMMGYQLGGFGYFGIALIFSGITSFASYYYSDKIVLTISGARPADRKRDFNFYTIIENLSIATGIPKPKLYVIDDSAPNAFTAGRNPEHAVICATTGILEKLNRTELEGVLAHELTHIRNFDTRLMSIVSVMVGIVALLGDWFLRMSWFGRRRDSKEESGQIGVILLILGLLFAIISPIIAKLIQLAISRRREFMADSGSVSITKQPKGLILALEKISSDTEALEAANKATAHLYIVNPFKGNIKSAVGWFSNLFNTHPPIEERVSALKKMI